MAEKKERLGGRIARWFREMKSELKKVVWPNWNQVSKNTTVVIVTVLVVCAFIALFDVLFTFGRDLLLGLR
ncbi:MAG: preprotein translocase subunit SecE [Ruminococcaceae bacterium]|nr:preprotein translocase subunit SecE [Oscillospiraceae bacterium]